MNQCQTVKRFLLEFPKSPVPSGPIPGNSIITDLDWTIRKHGYCPGWCGSVDWMAACKLKGHQFNSWSGHMPGLWARFPVGGIREATIHCSFSFSLSPSFPLSLKINKILKKKKENMVIIYALKWRRKNSKYSAKLYQVKFSKD